MYILVAERQRFVMDYSPDLVIYQPYPNPALNTLISPFSYLTGVHVTLPLR